MKTPTFSAESAIGPTGGHYRTAPQARRRQPAILGAELPVMERILGADNVGSGTTEAIPSSICRALEDCCAAGNADCCRALPLCYRP
jgi:hypothetical protein